MTEQQDKAYKFFAEQNFLPVDKNSHSVFKPYDENGNMLLEITATTSTIWGFGFNAVYKIIDSYLCSVWFYQNGSTYIIAQKPPKTPEGSLQQLIDDLYDLVTKAGLPSLQIWGIEEAALKDYLAIKGYDITNEYSDDMSEYSYRPKDVLELLGGVNLNKRNRLKKFLDKTNISLRPITKENISMCLDIEAEWCKHQDCELCASFAGCAKTSLEIMIDIFDKNVYNGMFGFIDETLAGYMIWEKSSKNIAFIYFAKAIVSDFNIYLYYLITGKYFSDIEFINAGHDMGKQGLRTFKKHLSAYEHWRKYLCTFKKI